MFIYTTFPKEIDEIRTKWSGYTCIRVEFNLNIEMLCFTQKSPKIALKI